MNNDLHQNHYNSRMNTFMNITEMYVEDYKDVFGAFSLDEQNIPNFNDVVYFTTVHSPLMKLMLVDVDMNDIKINNCNTEEDKFQEICRMYTYASSLYLRIGQVYNSYNL